MASKSMVGNWRLAAPAAVSLVRFLFAEPSKGVSAVVKSSAVTLGAFILLLDVSGVEDGVSANPYVAKDFKSAVKST